MAYKQQILIDGVTPINRALLQPMQDALSTAIYAVLTAKEMNDIIEEAQDDDVGGYYMYLGETTIYNGRSYKKGAVYTIEEV